VTSGTHPIFRCVTAHVMLVNLYVAASAVKPLLAILLHMSSKHYPASPASRSQPPHGLCSPSGSSQIQTRRHDVHGTDKPLPAQRRDGDKVLSNSIIRERGVQSARRYRLLSSSPDCGTPGDKIDPDPRVESVAADYTLESSLHCRSLPELCRCILRPRRRDCVAALRNNELWYPISSPRRSAGEKTRRVGVLVVSFFAAHAAEVVSNQRKSPTQLWLGTQRRRRPEQQYRVLSSRARIVPLPRQPHRR